MDSEKLIRNLIQNEENKDRKFILFMLLKFFSLVKTVKTKEGHLPLLLLLDNTFILIYKNKEFDDRKYIFTDYEEILNILQKSFYENKQIYFYSDLFEEKISKEELMEKINESIRKKDQEMFYYYAKKYNELG